MVVILWPYASINVIRTDDDDDDDDDDVDDDIVVADNFDLL